MTSASIAWSFLPENEQVQYLQKIALRAENPSGHKLFLRYGFIRLNGFLPGRAIIFCVSNFLLTIEVSTFSGQVSAIEARDAAIFTRIKEIFRAVWLGPSITGVIPPPVGK